MVRQNGELSAQSAIPGRTYLYVVRLGIQATLSLSRYRYGLDIGYEDDVFYCQHHV